MSTCPHCGQNGISLVRKWMSGSAAPARCRSCSGLSYVDTSVESEISLKTGMWGVGGLLLAGTMATFKLTGPAVAMAIVAVGSALVYYVVRWQRVALIKVSAEQAARNNRWGWAFFTLVVVLAILAVLAKG